MTPAKGHHLNLKSHIFDSHTMVFQATESGGKFEIVSVTLEPIAYLRKCLTGANHDLLMERVRSEEGQRRAEVTMGPIAASMMMAVVCVRQSNGQKLSEVIHTYVPEDMMKAGNDRWYNPDWEQWVLDGQRLKWYLDPDGSAHPAEPELFGKGRTRGGKVKS